jgi:carbon catabolite-derepressing protein kinase
MSLFYGEEELSIPPYRPRHSDRAHQYSDNHYAIPESSVPHPPQLHSQQQQQNQNQNQSQQQRQQQERQGRRAPSRPLAGIRPVHAESKSESRLGQYQIIKTLGEGSFGKVKLAIHEVTGQEVALKMISRKNVTSRDMAGRVEREIAYLQLLRHPHIIKLWVSFGYNRALDALSEADGGS